jgi:hypothetical protein
MTSAVLTPFARTAAKPAGGSHWRKRLLPVGEINYKGRVLRFTRDYLGGLVRAFQDQAYPQVPFQLADANNAHTNDVERFGGEITAMDLGHDGDEPGLWVTVATNQRGGNVLTDNPRLGVSARIVEDYDRSDGKFYPAAIQHVLGTLDPRIPHLGGWQAVEAANDVDITIDLSGAEFAGEGTGDMPELTEEQKRERLAKLLAIDPEDLDELIAGLHVNGDGNPAPTEPEGSELTDEELEELTKAAEALDAQGLLDEEGEPGREPATAGALSNSDALLALELSNARADQNAAELAEIRGHLDNERFLAERRGFAEDHGIPPYITDFARPLLEGTGHVVDLANGQQADAGQIMRKVLTEFGKLGKLLDMGMEMGSPLDEPDQQRVGEQAREDFVGRFKNQTGLR